MKPEFPYRWCLPSVLGAVRPLLQRHLVPLTAEKDFQQTTTQVRYTSVFTTSINMSSFVPTNYDLRTAVVFCYHLKETAAESYRMLVEAYGEHALGKTQCSEWFKKFKSGNFDVRNENRGKPPKKFEDWDQKGFIYYELLKPGETVNTNRYQQQMID